MLFHQGFGLLLDRFGLYWFTAFDPHRYLDSLGDFLVQAGADLHRFLPKTLRLAGEFCCGKLYQFRLIGVCWIAVLS